MMKTTRKISSSALSCCLLLTIIRTVPAQNMQQQALQNDSGSAVLTTSYTEKGLFETSEVLHLTLSGNLRPLLNNRVEEPVNYA